LPSSTANIRLHGPGHKAAIGPAIDRPAAMTAVAREAGTAVFGQNTPVPTQARSQGLFRNRSLDAMQPATLPQCQHVVPDATRAIRAVAAHEVLAHLCAEL